MKKPTTQEPTLSHPSAAPPAQDDNGAAHATAVQAPPAEQICRTILLKDIPAIEDAFSDPKQKTIGPHRTVADVIGSMIHEPEAEGVSIGLEGSWGSGKTTVVKLLDEALKDDPNITLIKFDAWAHEGDPLRRTFLETMIRHLQDEKVGWVNKEQWDKQLEKLANRKEVTTIKDTPTITGWGKAIGLMLLLVPIGGALFGQAIREPVAFGGTGPINWKFIFELTFGLLFSFAPLLILLPKRGRESGVLELILNKGATEKRTETDKTPNATSIEFEDYFKLLMSDALSNHPERRLVLVLDNLDRVDSKDALSIWATLQTFMQHKMDKDSDWYKRLWTLVLYDPKALSLLWKEKESASAAAVVNEMASQTGEDAQEDAQAAAAISAANQNQPPESQAIAETQGQKNQRVKTAAPSATTEIAASFIDKSFQIRFEVSPPVPSNWYTFLLERLTEAFPGHIEADNEFHAVYRVLSIDRVLTKQPTPTIRELKLYINQIGALHRQLALRHKCNGFPLSLMAYYVLLRRRRPNADIADGVLKKEIPEADFEGLLGNEVGDKLAALHYNVDVALARQVILGPPIKAALQEGNRAELIGYAGNPRAFWQALGKIIDSEWIPSESISICKAAYSLDDSRLLGNADQRSTRRVIDKLRDAALKITSWTPLDEVRATGIASLFNIVRERDFAAGLLEQMTKEFAAPDEFGSPSETNVLEWVDKLRFVLTRINELNWPELYEQKVIETLCRKLRGTKNQIFPIEHYQRVLETFYELGRAESDMHSDSDAARRSLSALVSEGHVSKYFHGWGGLTHYADAWCLFVVIGEDPKAAVQWLFKASETDAGFQQRAIEMFKSMPEEVSFNFTSLLGRYDAWEILFRMLDADTAYHPVVMKSLITLSASDYENYTIDPAGFLKHWPLLQQELDQGIAPTSFDKLIAVLAEKNPLAEKIIKQGFHPKWTACYIKIYKATPPGSQFREWLRKELEALEIDEWEQQFRQEGELLDLVNLFSIEGVQFTDDSRYREALVKCVKAVLDENVRPTHVTRSTGRSLDVYQRVNRWNNLTDVLNESSRSRFRAILDETFTTHATTREGKVPSVFFPIFAHELVVAEHPYRTISVLPRLLRILLNERQMDGLRWLAAMVKAHTRMFEDSGARSQFASFKTEIRSALFIEKDEMIVRILSEMVNTLNIPLADSLTGAYENIIKKLVQLGEEGHLALQLLQIMQAGNSLFSIPNELLTEEGKKLFSPKAENFEVLQSELSKIQGLINLDETRVSLEEQLVGILGKYYNQEFQRAASEQDYAETKDGLYRKFTDSIKTQPLLALEAGKKYLQKYEAKDGPQDQLVRYIKIWVAANEKPTHKNQLLQHIVDNDYNSAFTLGKQVLTDFPDDLHILYELSKAGVLAATDGNEAHNADAVNYAKRVLQLIHVGKSFKWDKYFANKDDFLGSLNYSLGFLLKKSQPSEALNYFITAAEFGGIAQKDPQTYGFMANIYKNEYKKLSAQLKVHCTTETAMKSPECIALKVRADQIMECMIDALARAVAYSDIGLRPAKHRQVRDKWMKFLTNNYKRHNNGSDRGLRELIANITSQPLPKPGETVEPKTPTP